jgi:metal-responsive CopG/Arc/MetJ family transcriptional regulator
LEFNVRILVDINPAHLRELDGMAGRERRSRAALIRQAVSEYLDKQSASQLGDAFGLWGDHKTDGVEYQEMMRSEW